MRTTKSIGIYNFSIELLNSLHEQQAVKDFRVLSNKTIPAPKGLADSGGLSDYQMPLDRRFGRIFWDQWRVYAEARKSNCRWLFLPKGFMSFVRKPKTKVAAYVHDTMGEYYRKQFPDHRFGFEQHYFRRSLRATLKYADVVFTNTDFSRGEILKLASTWNLAPPNVVTAGYGFRRLGQTAHETKSDSILLFASEQPHKRTDLAIERLKSWIQQTKYTGTVNCIGIFSDGAAMTRANKWNWMGRVSLVDVNRLIKQSRATIYTSQYEGFGMPPVESVMAGTCPVYSNIPPIREVMGSAGYFFSNENQAEFDLAMNRALDTPVEVVESWAEQLFARHKWENVVNTIVETLNKLS